MRLGLLSEFCPFLRTCAFCECWGIYKLLWIPKAKKSVAKKIYPYKIFKRRWYISRCLLTTTGGQKSIRQKFTPSLVGEGKGALFYVFLKSSSKIKLFLNVIFYLVPWTSFWKKLLVVVLLFLSNYFLLSLYQIRQTLILKYTFYLFFLKFTYLFLRERARERAREGQRENPKQAVCCQHRAQCGAWTHEPWDYDLSWNQELDA